MTGLGTALKTDVKPKELYPTEIQPPAQEERAKRLASFAAPGERKNRYTLPDGLQSNSPIGYRKRMPLTESEVDEALTLLSLERPSAFVECEGPTEQELFEECSLGVLASRQSTNFRGHQQVTFGPEDSAEIASLMKELGHLDAPVLDHAAYTHVVFSRPYRTPFTMLLTLVGHRSFTSLLTVPFRVFKKRTQFVSDIPTIGYLQELHLGILADSTERAAVLASEGRRRAQVHLRPFCGARKENKKVIAKLEKMCGLTLQERMMGYRVSMVVQVGEVHESEQLQIDPKLCRKLGANLLSFRSERIQPGVNQEEKAPEGYQHRQNMDVSDDLTVMAGRAAYNAFAHWAGVDREKAKSLLLMDRVDVLTPNGKARLRKIRNELGEITDKLVRDLPKWADIPAGKKFSRNAARGRKAFALVGQRIYIAGLSRESLEREGIDWELAVCAVGASAARSSLFVELMGTYNLPGDCDLLAGTCIMAGPVNQNDIGKQFYGYKDLLSDNYGDLDPTSLLVWTLKAKTIADPTGNEEQLLNAARKGALVDLRAGPHEVVKVASQGKLEPMRSFEGKLSEERAFFEQGNFVTDATGKEIPGNRGKPWSEFLARRKVW